MVSPIESEEYRGGRVEIHYDDGSGMNPRDDESNLSRFVFWPQRDIIDRNEIGFRFGDYDYEDGDETEEEWAVRKLREDHGALYVAPVHYSEHGPECQYRAWPEGSIGKREIGYAIVTPETVNEIGTPPELFAQVVAEEVARYGEWASGHVYGWVARDPHGKVIESVWGYIGSDEWEYMLSEARAAIDWWHDALDRKREDADADAMADLLRTVVNA